jgi:hypothetical protein
LCVGKIEVYRSAGGNGVRLDGGNGFAGAVITRTYIISIFFSSLSFFFLSFLFRSFFPFFLSFLFSFFQALCILRLTNPLLIAYYDSKFLD